MVDREAEREVPPKGLPGTPAREYLTVAQLNRTVRAAVDAEPALKGIWVLGELSNVKPTRTGILFPTLKDDLAQVSCRIWPQDLARMPFPPENGMKVLAHGSIDVYEKGGTYQLAIDRIERFGVGELHARMEALKAKLLAEGLLGRKRPLPPFPGVIGLVTSDSGAAVRDMVRILVRRFPLSRIILVPVQVQGTGAAEDIAEGIRAANVLPEPRPEVLLVGRGGGSLEDLWAFNEEPVARAIFASAIPVISAVGHETDITIADLVADLRAATPSEAAEKAVPDQEALRRDIDQGERSIDREVRHRLDESVRDLEEVTARLGDEATGRLDESEKELDRLDQLLASLDPSRVLRRGYALVSREGAVVDRVGSMSPGDNVTITMADGSADAEIHTVHPGTM